MKSSQQKVFELEAELLRLNEMVRARRRQLERLDACPNKDCECRTIWHEVTEQNLAGQVGKIRSSVKSKKTPLRRAPRKASSRKGK